MKIQLKLIFLFILLVLIFTSVLALQRYSEKQRVILLFQESKREKELVFDKLLELKGKSLYDYSYDYTYWDEMVGLINGEIDEAWANEMIDLSLPTYRANVVWIYSTDFSLVYSVNDVSRDKLKEIPLSRKVIDRIFQNENFCHFFLNTSAGLMEIRGATVHPSDDVERLTQPQGYFFAGRLWNKDYIEELSELTEGEIIVTPVREKVRFLDEPEKGKISLLRVLPAWDNTPIMYVNVMFESVSLKDFVRLSHRFFWEIIVFFILLLILIVLSLFAWISMPLRKISEALSEEDTNGLYKLKKNKDEFGDITRLICQFF